MGNGARIALVYGFWGQNIGNAFFNLGGEWILDHVLASTARVHLVQDQPGYHTFNTKAKGNPRGDLGLLDHVDVDAVVLQGPVLSRHFRPLWEQSFSAYRERGIRVVLLGGGLFKFDQTERQTVAAFLREFPPAVFVSRDSESFEFVSGLGLSTLCFDGIDSAFFLDRVVEPVPLRMGPFVTFTFDRYPEPTVSPAKGSTPAGGQRRISFDGHTVDLADPAIQLGAAKRGKWQAYLGHLIDRRKLPSTQFGRTVVRPEHRSRPHISRKIYQHPNAVVSDEPFTYLALYSQSDLVLSDRVHACVAAAAYGTPSMLFTPSPRARLLDRVGLTGIRELPTTLDRTALAREQEAELQFLREAFIYLEIAS